MRECIFLRCQSWCYQAPLRHVVGVMCLILVIVMYTHRQVFNMAIVQMVHESSGTVNKECKADKDVDVKNVGGGKYEWSENVQGVLLATFYLGYVPLQGIAGYLCDKYGARINVLICMSISTFITFILPTVVQHMHWGFTAFLRGVNGFVQSVTYPSVAALCGNWIPPNEKSTFGGIIFSGYSLGTIIGNFGTAQMISATSSWVYPFYLWGCVAILYLTFFGLFIYSAPEYNKNISPKELDYIKSTLIIKSKVKLPILKIFRDKAVWGYILGEFGSNFIVFSLTTNMPKYINNVLRMNMFKISLVASFPFIGIYIGALVLGLIGDTITKKYNFNIGLLRKIFTGIGNIVAALLLSVGISLRCRSTLIIIIFTIALFCKGGAYCGLKVNALEISRNHASFLIAIGNGLGSSTGFICPPLISFIAKDNTIDQWIIYSYIMFAVVTITTVIYFIIGSGERRKWDYTEEEMADYLANPPQKVKWYRERTAEEHIEYLAKVAAEKEARRLSKLQ